MTNLSRQKPFMAGLIGMVLREFFTPSDQSLILHIGRAVTLCANQRHSIASLYGHCPGTEHFEWNGLKAHLPGGSVRQQPSPPASVGSVCQSLRGTTSDIDTSPPGLSPARPDPARF